jgi:hypothetical protein
MCTYDESNSVDQLLNGLYICCDQRWFRSDKDLRSIIHLQKLYFQAYDWL